MREKQPSSSSSWLASLLLVHVPPSAATVVAVLEVADLVRERDVVRVRRPRDARVLARGRVHRVEGVRATASSRGVGSEVDLREAVRCTRRHRARLAARQVVDAHDQPRGRVVDVDGRACRLSS